eukprot:11371669-Alexandrium_andersonii.AAC.1
MSPAQPTMFHQRVVIDPSHLGPTPATSCSCRVQHSSHPRDPCSDVPRTRAGRVPVSYTHLRAHETSAHL